MNPKDWSVYMKKVKLLVVGLSLLSTFAAFSPSVSFSSSDGTQVYAATKYSFTQHFPKGKNPPDKMQITISKNKKVWAYLLNWNPSTRNATYYYYA